MIELIRDKGAYYIATSPLICSADQSMDYFLYYRELHHRHLLAQIQLRKYMEILELMCEIC